MEALTMLWLETGLATITIGQLLMLLVAGVLIYLAICRQFEPFD